jgi:hypothetical protein
VLFNLQFGCIDDSCNDLHRACFKDDSGPKKRDRVRTVSNKDQAPSMSNI